ncbi:MAG: hypothetical protein KAR13_11995 [Desulfobulbaceae bacterium]|nr:hypothetical protein [Desulfobulbaceae bacterium]MCK5437025.1 hypothetical protein [Desulfobulbaceae bacterium]MCK5545347.1 hypothetical protein [Desulfobulbaceae bacterium]
MNSSNRFPFTLNIQTSPDKVPLSGVDPRSQAGKVFGGYESVVCNGLVRKVPESREIFDGEWGGCQVIVKLFIGGRGAEGCVKREWYGLKKLQTLGILAPLPLFRGKTEEGAFALVVEKVLDSKTVKELWDGAKLDQRTVWLRLIFMELAKQHEKGVLQKDLHLGNFLLKGEDLYSLDPAEMKFSPAPVARKTAVSHLATLTTHMLRMDSGTVRDFLDLYMKRRGWRLDKKDLTLFEKRLALYGRRWLKKTLKKNLRSNSRLIRLNGDGFTAIFDRGLQGGADPVELIENIERFMKQGRGVKRGVNKAATSRFCWNGREFTAMAWEHPAIFSRLAHFITGTPARRAWLDGYRLLLLGHETPKPLACIEKGPKGFWNRSFLIVEVELYD